MCSGTLDNYKRHNFGLTWEGKWICAPFIKGNKLIWNYGLYPQLLMLGYWSRGPLTNFNPSMDKSAYPLWSVGWIYSSVPKLQYHWKLGMDKQFHPTLYSACDWLSMLRLKVIPCYINGTLNVTCHIFYWTISFSFPAFDGGFPDLCQ